MNIKCTDLYQPHHEKSAFVKVILFVNFGFLCIQPFFLNTQKGTENFSAIKIDTEVAWEEFLVS